MSRTDRPFPEDEPLDAGDLDLLAALARAADVHDPVPAGLTREIRFRLSVRALHAEVAEIVAEGAGTAALRGPHQARTETISFVAGDLSVLVTLTVHDEGVRVDGWLTGTGFSGPGADVRVLRSGAPSGDPVPVDEHGRFVVAPVARGVVQLLFTPADATRRPVVTRHVEL
ncbi:hypothetical protein [Auraticoccus monumenti]|uniref:Carboxypeptidase regulatory-like domain-containing protein n=1 Tax=Auraticoccus monumenti TaxID=675864 RepID=A0A1G6TN55_9ACTN|nr:hypothetical protein [Auraticoccus monumenti]SDD30533.1 hypothetical protein SAMN04489747_0663 [Auraticoccus monumenti]